MRMLLISMTEMEWCKADVCSNLLTLKYCHQFVWNLDRGGKANTSEEHIDYIAATRS